jgi:cytochrome bd-type quinol oxidase subunit 2
MKKYLKAFSAFIIIPLLILVSGGVQVSAFSLFDRTCSGGKVQGGNGSTSPVCESSHSSRNDNGYNNVVLSTLNDAINIMAVVAGTAAVIIIIIAGFTYATAGGNAEETKNARNRILWASIGLVIISLAWTITRFITDKVL